MAGGDQPEKPISLFYSYSHKDEELRQRLEDHLAVLRWSGLIAEWHDRNIDVGDEWAKEIDDNLSTADIILLLVSASFIASKYCWSVEMTKALQRHDKGEAKVVPVILRPCRWGVTPFAKLQAAPTDAKPVTSRPDPDAALDDVAGKIARVVTELQQQRRREAELLSASEEQQRKAQQQREQQADQRAAVVRVAAAPEERREDERHRRQRLRVSALITLVFLVVGGAVFALSDWQRAQSPEPDAERPVVAAPKEEEKAQAAVSAPSPAAKMQLLKPSDPFTDCAGCPEMVVVPGGSFMMGSPDTEAGRYSSEGPQHKVTIQPFAIGKDEVTFDQWDACAAAGDCRGYRPDDNGWGRGPRPVINVSWQDAQAYVSWLAQQTGKPYRLPSEAEWEYAARAGTTTPFALPAPKGGITIGGMDLANCVGCGSQWDGKSTAPVGNFSANAWGLYDMHGNVWEWVGDVYHDSYKGAPSDGSMWTEGEGKESSRDRVFRGGSWLSYPRGLRSALRDRNEPGYRGGILGFRVARTLD